VKLSGLREKIVESRNKLLLETENSVYEIDLKTNLQQNLKIKYASIKLFRLLERPKIINSYSGLNLL